MSGFKGMIIIYGKLHMSTHSASLVIPTTELLSMCSCLQQLPISFSDYFVYSCTSQVNNCCWQSSDVIHTSRWCIHVNFVIYSLIQDDCRDDLFFCVPVFLQDVLRFVISWLLWKKCSRYMAIINA